MPGARLTVVDLRTQVDTLAVGLPSRTIAHANENCLKLSVYAGTGDWHRHFTTDEIFVVLEGELFLDVFEGETVAVGPQQVVTVPAGVVHRPRAEVRTVLLCFKPAESKTEYYELVAATAEGSAG
jgi:mannose-6-phosphate isomerase-like protein (cupin superfamily)